MADSSIIYDNEFGAVYSDRIAFRAKKGWFSGGVLEELPTRHITSVRVETTRKLFLGLILVFLGLGLLSVGTAGAVIFGLLFVVFGVLLVIGWPVVTINTAGNDLRKASGGIWQKGNAEEFAVAVRKALFDKP